MRSSRSRCGTFFTAASRIYTAFSSPSREIRLLSCISATSANATSAACTGESGVMRNKTTPLPAGGPRRKTSSPKSLSNVGRILCWSGAESGDFLIPNAGALFSDREDVPTGVSQSLQGRFRGNSRRPGRSCRFEGINLRLARKLAREGETGQDILLGEVRIAGQNLLVVPTAASSSNTNSTDMRVPRSSMHYLHAGPETVANASLGKWIASRTLRFFTRVAYCMMSGTSMPDLSLPRNLAFEATC